MLTPGDPSGPRSAGGSATPAEPPAHRLDHAAIAVLGLLTIVAYGSWYYAFGVLLDPIRLDTGWGESLLAASFAIGIAVVGLTSAWGGLLLDRWGGRRVFVLGGMGGGVGLLGASMATDPIVFMLSAALGMGCLGAFGFYHVTMTAAVRANADESGGPTSAAVASRSIAVLTIWGAFASAIYLPATAALVERFEWRVTIRMLAAVVVLSFAVAALSVRVPPATTSGPPPSLRRLIATAVDGRHRRALTAAIALGGVAMSTVLVYQVPAMTAAGLPLATAATLAGLRGVAQTLGRVPLAPIVARLGSTRAMVLAFVALALGGGLLSVAGSVGLGVAFAVTAGFGIGAFSPLQGIKTGELYDHDILGGAMGFNSSVLMVAGAIGPVLSGVLADAGGDRRVVGPIIMASALGAAVAASRVTDPAATDDACNT